MKKFEQRENRSSDLVAGRKPVSELLDNEAGRVDIVLFRKGKGDHNLERIIKKSKSLGVKHRFVDKTELDRSFKGNHQGVVAYTSAVSYLGVGELMQTAKDAPMPLIVALDQVQDPGNVGALVRSMYALGAGGLLMPKHHAASLGPGALKASAGALTRLPVARATNLGQALDRCADEGFMLFAAHTTEQSLPIYEADLRVPAVLVLGSEEKGIRPSIANRCVDAVHLPMAREFDSLNVAQAGAMCVAEFARRFGPWRSR